MWAYGNVPTGWKICKVKDYSTVVTDYVANGSFASLAKNVNYKDTEDEAVLIRLTDFNNGFNGNFVYIDNHAYEFLSKSKLFGGEIIISNVGANVGTVFKCPYLDKKMSLAPNSIMLKTLGNDDFYYYWFSSRNGQHSLKSIVTGSAQPKFNKTNFRDLEIPVPPIETQNRIVSILKSIDSKIELNNKINNNLFEQAKALYKSWMFDFEPFSADRSLPKGWKISTVKEVIQLHDSKRVPLSSRQRESMEKIYPYYGATSQMDMVDNYLFDGIYLLLGEDGTVVDSQGYPILQYVEGKFWVNNHAHIMTGINGFSVELLYLLFSLTNVAHIVTGAVQPKISQNNLFKLPAVIPTSDVLVELNDIIQPIFAEIRNLRQENKQLTALRDSLLPKLMSGELDVSELDI